MMEKKLRIKDRECQALASKDAGTPIMFLHGFSYTSDVWRRTGTLNALIERKIPFLALDMPYGKKSACVPKSSDVVTNEIFAFEAFKGEFGLETPSVIVGASLGGYIALRYAARRHVKALMLISPTRTGQQELVEAFSRFNFPVRIVWGSRDIIVSERDLREMVSRLPNAKISVYEGAGHSAYKDQPEKFNRELLELYAQVK